jgi:hypothetical protein
MIWIDMEMPESCSCCPMMCPMYTSYLISKNFCSDVNKPIPKDEYQNKRYQGCPLIELPSENMTWEELVEKVKSLNSKYIQIEKDRIIIDEIEKISFIKNGAITRFSSIIAIGRTNFQMYQIIKSLVGEGR